MLSPERKEELNKIYLQMTSGPEGSIFLGNGIYQILKNLDEEETNYFLRLDYPLSDHASAPSPEVKNDSSARNSLLTFFSAVSSWIRHR
jgi:hypothetical protein